MKVTRTSIITGKEHTMDLPITQEQVVNYNNGMMIQDAMPNLSPSQREFILNGITDEEWDTTIKD